MKRIGTVMLVDDEEIDQKTYERVLRKTGLVDRVLAFTYADEALQFLKENPQEQVDVIFLDINMPRMSGFEFLDAATLELSEDYAKLVVVMLTTSMLQSDRLKASEYPLVKAFFEKPMTQSQIEEASQLLAAQHA